jgi:hypothetical protein
VFGRIPKSELDFVNGQLHVVDSRRAMATFVPFRLLQLAVCALQRAKSILHVRLVCDGSSSDEGHRQSHQRKN